MKGAGVDPNSTTYGFLINRYRRSDNFEMALKLLFEMEERGLDPPLGTIEDILALAVRRGHARLALELAENFETGSVRRLNDSTWVRCLIAATGTLYVRTMRLRC